MVLSREPKSGVMQHDKGGWPKASVTTSEAAEIELPSWVNVMVPNTIFLAIGNTDERYSSTTMCSPLIETSKRDCFVRPPRVAP